MSFEALYYSEMSRLGRAPKTKHFTHQELSDPTLPARLAYGKHIGACGYRSVRADDGSIWYWPRKSANWWIVPDALEASAQSCMDAVISAASDERGRSTNNAVKAALRERLSRMGIPITIMDSRLRAVLFPLPAENTLSAALNKRIDTLMTQRNRCEDWDVDHIDFELIEIALEVGI
jgi:hypothetical protein